MYYLLHSGEFSSGPCLLCILNNADQTVCDHMVEDFIIKHRRGTN